MTWFYNHKSPAGRAWLSLTALLAFVCTTLGTPALAEGPTVGKKTSMQIHCMGQKWKVPVYTTSDDEEVLVRADEKDLRAAARQLGRDLTWSSGESTLTGDPGMVLALGQTLLKDRTLSLAPLTLDGAVFFPISALEELLDCQVTVKKGSIYIEPTLRGLAFEEDGENGATLHIETTVPVRKKVLKLSNPPRTVIDLIGVSIPKKDFDLVHPMLGEVRVALNQSAPSVTRIVVPSPSGIKIATPKSFDLFEHQVAVSWRKGQPAVLVDGRPNPNAPVQTVQIPKTPPGQGRAPVIEIGKTPRAPSRSPVVEVTPSPSAPKRPPVVEVGENPDDRQESPTPTAQKTGGPKRPLLLEASWKGRQLKLVFSEPVTYRWSRLNAGQHRYILDFPGVIFPDKRQTLPSSISGLEAVRIVQNMPEPTPIVRLVCDLQTPLAVTTIPDNDKELYLEFPGRSVSPGELAKGVGQTQKPEPGSALGRTICLDAGHGGSDPGAINRSYGVSEKQVTLDITLRLAAMLKAEGWNVVMTRTVDRDVTYAGSPDKDELGARSTMANEHGADLFVSIHCNSAANTTVGGTSIHWFKSGDYTLAKSLESELIVATGRAHRGLIKDRFFVLAHTQMPAVLIETAFLSNQQEGQLLANPEYRERIARGIAAGLRSYAAQRFPLSSAGK